MGKFTGYAAHDPSGVLKQISYNPGPLEPDDVEIDVINCGLCHSDISMVKNDWHITDYPIIPGHEVIGTISDCGEQALAHGLKIGQNVGLGWFAGSCLHCHTCLSGHHNLCADAEQTIVGRHGGFADKVRCKWEWAIPLPNELDLKSAGPLFCGGITVFNPIIISNVKPTDKVGVIGIGGLGHLAIQFLNKWGCEVTAFTSTGAKADEARSLGAHHIINSRSDAEIEAAAGQFDFILSTVNVPLNWKGYINALKPKGKLHNVGAVMEPLPVESFDLIMGERSVGGSSLGPPATNMDMIDFCMRHDIKPVIETFNMNEINDAIAHLEASKARYRIVLEN